MNLCRSKIKTDTFNLSRTLAIFVTTKLQVQIQVFHHLNGIQDTLFPTRKIALWQIEAEGKKKTISKYYYCEVETFKELMHKY